VELLAYVGDYLSYRQDAVATEAYLGTARRRASARRHARLVDYPTDDGSNARVWAQVQAGANGVGLPRGTQLLTRVGDQPPRLAEGSLQLERALAAGPEVFERPTTSSSSTPGATASAACPKGRGAPPCGGTWRPCAWAIT
jgi:hypothetical protein